MESFYSTSFPKKTGKPVQTVRWELLQCSGQVPTARCGQSVVINKRKAYLFGGYGGFVESPGPLAGLYCYNFDSTSWEIVEACGLSPCPRTTMAMCAAPDGFIYLWGGTGNDLQGFENQELYKFDTLLNTWSQVESKRNPDLNYRYFGRTCNYHNSTIYFFGGGFKGRVFTNELVAYNLQENRWNILETTGDIPPPRYKHTTCIVEETLFVIGGGCHLPLEETIDVYALCLVTMNWKRIETFGEHPVGRVAHTSEYDAISKSIFVWGGFDSKMASLPDFYVLDLRTYEWSPRVIAENPQCRRRFHSSCLFEGALYSFNGSDGENCYADLLRCQVYYTPQSLLHLTLQASSMNSRIEGKLNYLPSELTVLTEAAESGAINKNNIPCLTRPPLCHASGSNVRTKQLKVLLVLFFFSIFSFALWNDFVTTKTARFFLCKVG